MQDTQLISKAGARGNVHVIVRGQDGEIKHDAYHKNVVCDAGLTLFANRGTHSSPTSDCLIDYISVGTDVTAPLAADTLLGVETARKAVLSRTSDGTVMAISTTFAAGEVPTSTIKELGLWIDATATLDTGVLLAHVADSFAVTALDSVFVDWRITFADA